MDYLPLIGIVTVAAGFALRLRITVTVLAAGLVTGLVAGMPFVGTDGSPGIVDTLGRAFVNGRIITLFVLALPAIGLSERYGLQGRGYFDSRGLQASVYAQGDHWIEEAYERLRRYTRLSSVVAAWP